MEKILPLLLLLCLFCGCASVATNTITQVSTIDALLAGSYDGVMSCGELLKYGDFGIGTFDRLEGEMIILDDRVFQVKSDGLVYSPSLSILTPFASVGYFVPDKRFDLPPGADLHGAEDAIDTAVPNKNIFLALKIHGTFRYMKTRSVPLQDKPYPALTEVTKNQPVFEISDVSGTIVGFRCPDYVKGINVPGYHFHFISDDLKKGGHVLDFTLKEGTVEADLCGRYLLILPDDGKGLEGLDLSRDRSAELQKVER
ncbi:MAG: acetolactate decarboxylase [Candidatus Omnitrophica bacterium]|nr:acetolactate decarboxylase [Candidatus Omnitrophota bacterium]